MGRTREKASSAEQFGKRVRERRLKANLSQMALAERAGMHFTYVSSVERGERNISLTNIIRLAAALGADPGDLVSGLHRSA